MKCVVTDMPRHEALRTTAAHWSFSEWGKLYPDDSVQWYLDLYAASDQDERSLPVCLAAMNEDGSIVGTASLIANDELPNAPEPGPWVAAVYVDSAYRGAGVGTELVLETVRRARNLGFDDVYLYTESVSKWYESMGWKTIRTDDSLGVQVTVMVHHA
jgi:N-acetylglutamate synthase-like GNAT family acetyltransferase